MSNIRIRLIQFPETIKEIKQVGFLDRSNFFFLNHSSVIFCNEKKVGEAIVKVNKKFSFVFFFFIRSYTVVFMRDMSLLTLEKKNTNLFTNLNIFLIISYTMYYEINMEDKSPYDYGKFNYKFKPAKRK